MERALGGPDRDLRNSVYDGMFANVFATLTGGAFLTGFALNLGMSDAFIGVLAALPFVTSVFQIPAATHLVRRGRRRCLCLRAARTARLAWVPLLLLPFLPLSDAVRIGLALAILTVSYAHVSVSFVSWLSWITDLVPEDIRGRFFGTRNMLCGTAGMIATIVAGHLLDLFRRAGDLGADLGFALIFCLAVTAGVASLSFLRRIPEPASAVPRRSRAKSVATPLRDPGFRRYLSFTVAWGFSVNFASPFLNVYLLRDLGFDYGFVAALTAVSGASDLVAMRFWGALSDRVKNKPVIRVAGVVAATLPLAWLAIGRDSFLLPIFLYAVGGGFWAGINLCSSNLLLRITPPETRPLYFSAHGVLGGLGAAGGPLVAGLFLAGIGGSAPVHLLGTTFFPLQALFVGSWILRTLSLLLLARVREPEEASIGQVVRVLRSLRGMTTVAGFAYLLHPFLEVSRDLTGRRSRGMFEKARDRARHSQVSPGGK